MRSERIGISQADQAGSAETSSAHRYRVPVVLDDLNNPHTLAVLSTPPGTKVLDVGCGPGVVAAALVKRRCSVWGIEMDPESAEAAREHCEAVVNSDVEVLDFAASFGSQQFDVVLVLDVLEHLRNPAELLRRLAPLINHGGLIMASIPNITHGAVRLALLSGQFPYSEKGLLDRDHLRFFDAVTVKELFSVAGYSVQSQLRVVRDLDQTEIPLDLSAYPETLLTDLRNDPVALTYQFFIIASPIPSTLAKCAEPPSAGKLGFDQMLAERYQSRITELEQLVRQSESDVRHLEESLRERDAAQSFLERDIHIKEEYVVKTRAELHKVRARLEALEGKCASLQASLEQARLTEARLHHEVAERQTLIEAMRATRIWRLRTLARSAFRSRSAKEETSAAAEIETTKAPAVYNAAHDPMRMRRQAERWFECHPTFFFLGLGRSGTMFLSQLLDHAQDVAIFHEPIPEDAVAFVEARASSEAAVDYVRNFRKTRMYELAVQRGGNTYGEVNSWLRFHAQALRACFPTITILHLVRDGRDVVRSIMNMGHYTDGALEKHYHLEPTRDDPLRSAWNELSRFEKVCWLWADANSRLREGIDGVVRFENLIGSYEYVRENIEKVLGIEIGSDTWSHVVQTPVNASSQFTLPHWTAWDAPLRAAFERICGTEMGRLGYW